MMSQPMTPAALAETRCSHQTAALPDAEITRYLGLTDGWLLEEGRIARTFKFKNYYETLAFVNAIAYVIHTEDHHPDLAVSYNRCTVRFHTHSVNNGQGGLSLNDFICAAKIDAIFRQSFTQS